MPDIGRRRILAGLGALIGVGSVLPAADPASRPDRFEHRGIQVWWSGWRTPANQDAMIGWWLASVPADDCGLNLLYSTMGGVIQRAAEMFVLDCTYQKDWPKLTARSTQAELDVVKQRAAQHLIEHLNA